MNDYEVLKRITINLEVMAGKPVIEGTRLTVRYILNLLAHGATIEDIISEHQGLTETDIKACLLFASKFLESSAFMPLIA